MGAPAGFFSTFGALTSSIEGGTRLSDADAAAWAAEFTEPDQRAGMLGTDVASMALIVERLAEYTTSGLSDTRLKHAFPALDRHEGGCANTCPTALSAGNARSATEVAAPVAAVVARRYVSASACSECAPTVVFAAPESVPSPERTAATVAVGLGGVFVAFVTCRGGVWQR